MLASHSRRVLGVVSRLVASESNGLDWSNEARLGAGWGRFEEADED